MAGSSGCEPGQRVDSVPFRASLVGCRSLPEVCGGLLEVPSVLNEGAWVVGRMEFSADQVFILGQPSGHGRGLLSANWDVEMLLSHYNTWAKLLREAPSDHEMVAGVHFEIMQGPADAQQGWPQLWRPRQVCFSAGDGGPRVIGMMRDAASTMRADRIWLSNYVREIQATDVGSDSDATPPTPPSPPMRDV